MKTTTEHINQLYGVLYNDYIMNSVKEAMDF